MSDARPSDERARDDQDDHGDRDDHDDDQVRDVGGRGSDPGADRGTDRGTDTVRIDRWLWAVRLVKTRSAAANACRGGHVRINGRVAKPATLVRPGDRVAAYVAGRQRVVDVTRVLGKRVGAPLAAEHYDDHSPPPPPREQQAAPFVRDPGSGRPTKKERRQLDRLRGRRR